MASTLIQFLFIVTTELLRLIKTNDYLVLKYVRKLKEQQLHPEVVNENIVLRVLMITFKISKFVARYDLEPIYSVDGSEKLHYVVDLYQRENHFFPIVRRRDYFCISPTKLSELCGEELLIYDIVEEWEAIHGTTEEEVLQWPMLRF